MLAVRPRDVRTLDALKGPDMAMERTAVNPWTWSVAMGYNQGELVSGQTRILYCSGQAAMSGDGTPQHAGDMAAQLALSLDNLEVLLGAAGLSLTNLVRLNVYTTDVDLLFQHYGVLASRLGVLLQEVSTPIPAAWKGYSVRKTVSGLAPSSP